MAMIGSLDVPDELIDLFNKLFNIGDNRVNGTLRLTNGFQSRTKVVNLTKKSLLPQIKELKDSLSESEILAWKSAALANNTNWYNLFVQDTCYRLQYGLSGLAVPSDLYQYKVGKIEIGAPASKVLLAQFHPPVYYVNKKIRGSTTVRENVAIYEALSLPLLIGLSYKSNLDSINDNPIVQFYAVVKSSYQGRTIETKFAIDLNLNTDWSRETLNITSVLGVARSYSLYILIDGATGTFYFDNILARHSGVNYARDWRCSDVNNDLTRTNFMIEKSWEEQFLPSGAKFDSVYHEF